MSDSQKKPWIKPKILEENLRALLQSEISDASLRAELETLCKQPAFPGFTWLWGPKLYQKNRVLFRPFILSHFSNSLFESPVKWAFLPWNQDKGKFLDPWLAQVDENDDIELFKRLYQWKITGKLWRINSDQVCRDLVNRYKNAPSKALRGLILLKFDIWFSLDEPTAKELYTIDPETSKHFISRHLPFAFSWWLSEKRQLWQGLFSLAREKNDEDFAFTLYRKQVPFKQWKQDVLSLCEDIHDANNLIRALENRHLEGYWGDRSEVFHLLLQARGTEIFPYVMKNLFQVQSGFWWNKGYENILKLAREKKWWNLWATLIRVSGQPEDFNREILVLLNDRNLSKDEIVSRLMVLSGVSHEWNFPGFGIARLQPLYDQTAITMYEKHPDMLRTRFKMHLFLTYGKTYKKLIEKLICEKDENLIDFLASRAITRGGGFSSTDDLALAESLSKYYETMKDDSVKFARRAVSVLSYIPAYAIFDYNGILKNNRLARLFFERSSESYLSDSLGMQNLIEAPEIHVQAMAYRALQINDDRAKAIVQENLPVLLGTFLRPLHKRTRICAFGALLNGASNLDSARIIHAKAREALDLPDKRYPKEHLIGFIGKLIHRWPQLRAQGETLTEYKAELS